MTTNTYFSPFYPPVVSPGAKGTTKPIVTSSEVTIIRSDVSTVKQNIEDIRKEIDDFADEIAGDTTPPGVPTNLGGSSTITDGGLSSLLISWTAPTDDDVAGYDLSIKENSGGFIDFTTSSTSYKLNGLNRNSTFTFKVRAYDKSGNKGAYTQTVSLVTAKDNTPPGVVTGLIADVSYESVFVNYVAPGDSDVARVQLNLYKPPSTDPVDAISVNAYSNQRGTATFTNLSRATPYYVVAYAYDTSNNQSAGSSALNFTTSGGLAAADFAPNVTAIPTVTSLPATGNTGPQIVLYNGKLYRWSNGAWTTAVDSGDLANNSVSTEKLVDGSVSGVKIVNNAIDANKLADNSVTTVKLVDGTISTVKLANGAINSSKLSDNAVTTTKLVDGSVANEKIANGAINAAKISDNVITTQKLVDGTVTGVKISDDTITGAKIKANTITGDKIVANTINTNKLVAQTRPISIIGMNMRVDADGVLRWDAGLASFQDFDGTFNNRTLSADGYRYNGVRVWIYLYVGQGASNTNFDTREGFNPPDLSYNDNYKLVAVWNGGSDLTVNAGVGTQINGDQIVTGSIKASRIAANTITANKLTIGDFTNFAENSDFALGPDVGWGLQSIGGNLPRIVPAPGVGGTSNTYRGSPYVGYLVNGEGGYRNRGLMRVAPGDKLYGYIYGNLTSTSNGDYAVVRISYLSSNGDELTVEASGSLPPTAQHPDTGGWQKAQVFGTVPAGATFARVECFSRSYTGEFFFGMAGLLRRSTGELIVDGSISANKIAANSIDATKIVAGSITATQIAGNTVSGDKIVGNTISGDKIQSNAITTDKIATNSITANRLALVTRPFSTLGLNMRIDPDGVLRWDSGYVQYTDNNAAYSDQQIVAGGVPWAGQRIYIIWNAAYRSPYFDNTTDSNYLTDSNFMHVATWDGGTNLILKAGVGTLLNGDRIVTGTLNANRIIANSITGDKIAGNTITAANIAGSTITGDRIAGNTITGDKIVANSITTNKIVAQSRPFSIIGMNMRVDENGVLRWDGGTASFQDVNGNINNRALSGGSYGYNGTRVWLYLYVGQNASNTNLDSQESFGPPGLSTNGDYKLVAVWNGGSDLTVNAGVGTMINGGQIVTNSINADKIVSNSITANQIAGGTITGDKLVAGTISAAQIGAGAIVASKLAIGNVNNIIPDSEMNEVAFWNGSNGGVERGNPTPQVSVGPQNSGWKFAKRMLINPVGDAVWYTPFFPIEIGATYKLTYSIWLSGDFNGWFKPCLHQPGIRWLPIKAGYNDGTDPNIDDAAAFHAGESRSDLVDKIFTVPEETNNSTRYTQFRFQGNWTAGYVEFMVKIVRVSDSTLIQDGAISTNKITVNSLNGDRIQAGTLSADKIMANSVMSGSVIVNNTPLSTAVSQARNAGNNLWYLLADDYTIEANKITKKRVDDWSTNSYTRDLIQDGCKMSGRMATDSTFIGLSDQQQGGNYGVIDYAWHRSEDGNTYIYEDGNQVASIGNSSNAGVPDLIMQIVYDGRTIRYIRNEYVHREVVVGSGRKFAGAVAIGRIGKYVDSLSLSPYGDNSLYRADPAAVVNSKSTQILPGLINISGGTTLASWRQGGDDTRIAGGAISANTITTNKLTVGNRAISTIGLNFEWNPNNNFVTWDQGYIYFGNDGGNGVDGVYISPGNTNGAPAHQFFYWIRGENQIRYSQDQNQTMGSDRVMLGAWWGGSNLNMTYGGTIINGDRITTNTINANKIQAGTILSESIVIGNRGSVGSAFDSASWGSVSGRPSSLGDLDGNANNKLSGIQSGATVGAPSGTMVGNTEAQTVTNWAYTGQQDPAGRINSGSTTISGGKITTGSITAEKINVGSLSAITANIGFLVSYNGQGGRVERDGNGTRVYGNNGALRVKVGF